MKKSLAAILCFSIILLSPGLACYAQIADITSSGRFSGADAAQALPADGFGLNPAQNAELNFGADNVNQNLSLLEQIGADSLESGSQISNISAPAQDTLVILARHPGESRGPATWIPASAGMTERQDEGTNLAFGKVPAHAIQQTATTLDNSAVANRSLRSFSASTAFAKAKALIQGVTRFWQNQNAGTVSQNVSSADGAVQTLCAMAPVQISKRPIVNSQNLAQPPPPQPPASRPGNRALGFLSAALRIGVSAWALVHAQTLAATLAPAFFGLSTSALVWALSPGIFVLPLALYTRAALGRRDSARLRKIKWIYDVSIGICIGGMALLAPHVSLAALAGAFSGHGLASIKTAAAAIFGSGLHFSAKTFLPIGLGPFLTMAAMPVLTTLVFFNPFIIRAAESGFAFKMPAGPLGQGATRWPASTWIMLGLLFAAFTGYSPVHVPIHFISWLTDVDLLFYAWMKWGDTKTFNRIYLGAILLAASLYFLPFKFLAGAGIAAVLAFGVDRARALTEGLIARFLPQGQAAPSTWQPPQNDIPANAPARMPKSHFWLKTALALGIMSGMVALTAVVLGSIWGSLAIAAVLSSVGFFLSKFLIKKIQRVKPIDPEKNPSDRIKKEVLEEVLGNLNAYRMAHRKWWQFWVKPYPMPKNGDIVNDPAPYPNAYATGFSPNHAMVGITKGMEQMLLVPANLRQAVVARLGSYSADSLEFWSDRKEIGRFISGVRPDSTPEDVARAVMSASDAEVLELGKDALAGVWSHEWSHEWRHHMLIGALVGTMSSTINFVALGVLWKLAQGKKPDSVLKANKAPVAGRYRKIIDPVSAGLLLSEAPAFLAQWLPTLMQVLQMTSSRNDEAQADDGGARITGHPESLALALGLLEGWRPPENLIGSLSRGQKAFLLAYANDFLTNPIAQLKLQPKKADAPEVRIGRGESLLFDLLNGSHPETQARIMYLARMAKAMSEGKRPR